MARERLFYLPLGGAGEIGMNMYVYGYGVQGRERLIVVDAGVAFANMETHPGIDLIMPNMDWLKRRAADVDGIFVTHAHEDHLGAIHHLLRDVNAPLYAGAFTLRLAQHKLEEARILGTTMIDHQVGEENSVKAGPFKVCRMPVSHSVPDASALSIDTPKGRIIHSGDFKTDIDQDEGAADGHVFSAAWREAAKSEIIALVCDSTNIHVARPGRPESSIVPALSAIISNAKGLIAATTFASNVARVRHLARAGHEAGRSVVLLGRAMTRMVRIATESGVMDFPPFLEPEAAYNLPKNKLLLLTTGSQGEPRSATAQLSRGKFRGFKLGDGDTLLMSSRTIPGNELSVARVLNRLADLGVRVIEDHDGACHVSGHANRPDVTDLHQLMSPRLVVPMHGEARHLAEHADLAAANGFATLVVNNGQVLNLCSGQINEEVEDVGRDYIDGKLVIPGSSQVTRDRLRLARDGLITVAVSFGEHSDDLDVAAKCVGLYSNTNCSLEDGVMETVLAKLNSHELQNQDDIEIIKRELTAAVRRFVVKECGKRPVVILLFTEL